MKFSTAIIAIAAILLVIATLAPSADARIPKRKLKALRKVGLALVLLKGNKKILFPLPLPLPLPLPVLQKHVAISEPVAVAEPVAVPEPVAIPEPVYAEPAYGGESYAAASYGAESYAAPAAHSYPAAAAYPGAY